MTVAEGVARIALRYPRANALSASLVDALTGQLDTALLNNDVHTVVFDGSVGDFSTGFDLSEIDKQSDAELLLRFVKLEQLLDSISRAPVRTIASATGRAWGAGGDLFAACDVRIASSRASFRFPGSAFGLVLGARRLAARIGSDRAIDYVSTGAILAADVANVLGLVTACTDAPAEWLARHLEQPTVDRATMLSLRNAVTQAMSDQDLAALVRSAARPGLQQRLQQYRARLRKSNQATDAAT
jgi:enoyl-CoA hydratase/carnithine racemase